MSDEQERDGAPGDECVEPASTEKGDDSFSPWDDYQEAFGDPQPIPVVTAPDTGMPNLAPIESASHAPPFTLEWFTCAADNSEFVVRGKWGEIIARAPAEHVERTPDGRWRAPTKLVLESARAWIEEHRDNYEENPENDLHVLSQAANNQEPRREYAFDAAWFQVRPKREQCRHLMQQIMPPASGEQQSAMNPDGLKYGWGKRLCTARRTTTGAFMELTDDAIRACSMRDPAEERGLTLLDRFDHDALERSRNRVHLSMFNFKSLRDETKEDPSKGGIFGGAKA